MRIVAVGAHVDDVEIFCAGTLAKAAREKQAEVSIVCLTRAPDPAYASDQRTLGQQSAALIGANFQQLSTVEGTLGMSDRAGEELLETLVTLKPDVLITHPPTDHSNPDHAAASRIVQRVTLRVSHDSIVLEKAPAVLFFDALAGFGFTPTEYVDISQTMDIKRQMLATFVAQNKLFAARDPGGNDMVDLMEAQCRFRGLQAGCTYAEAFQFWSASFRTFPRSLPWEGLELEAKTHGNADS